METTDGGRLRGFVAVAGAAMTWGTWSLFFRPAERHGPIAPAFEALVVMVVMALALAPLAIREARGKTRTRRELALLGATGVCDAGNVLCFFAAMQRTSLAIAVLTHYLAPVIVATLAPLVLREPTSRATRLALLASLSGLVLLLEPWRGATGGAALGAALGGASALFYAANVLLTKALQRTLGPGEIVVFHAAPAVLLLALFVPAGGFAIAPAALAWLVGGALLAGALAGLAFLYGLARVPASQASALTLLEPLVAVGVGAAVWGERPGPLALVGASLIASGAWLVMRPPTGVSRRSRPDPSPSRP